MKLIFNRLYKELVLAKVLITGANGFAGAHLSQYLIGLGQEVLGVDRASKSVLKSARYDFISCDVCDTEKIKSLIRDYRPQYIIHLAAKSSVADSWADLSEIYKVNCFGQLNILEAAIALRPMPRVLVACSGQEYGVVLPEELPLTEESSLRPNNPYATSKVFQDFLGYQYFLSYNLPVVRSRAFNHTGPGQSTLFVCSDFAEQIVCIEKGQKEPIIEVGNLGAKRDFSDVRDVVRAYWDLATKGRAGEVYNICSGRAFSAKEVLEILLKFSKEKIEVKVNLDKSRPSDIPVLVGDFRKINSETGWKPRIPFKKTLEDLLNWWREVL